MRDRLTKSSPRHAWFPCSLVFSHSLFCLSFPFLVILICLISESKFKNSKIRAIEQSVQLYMSKPMCIAKYISEPLIYLNCCWYQVPLANMTGLKLLNVSHNNLTEIPRGSVPKLYYLHTVDFSYNRLTTIAAVVFQVVFGLRTMLFQHNELEELTYGTLGSLPTVLHLDLSHNRFVIFKYTVVIIPILPP